LKRESVLAARPPFLRSLNTLRLCVPGPCINFSSSRNATKRCQCQCQRTGRRYRNDSNHFEAYETHFHFFILGWDGESHRLACLANLSESVTYTMSACGGSPANRPNLFHCGSDGSTETGTGSLALRRYNKPPVPPTFFLFCDVLWSFQGRHERDQALTGTPPFRPWTFPKLSPLR
jgi:hypothetical protein